MNEHKHLFEMVGNTWACFGHSDQCGLRAPACFTPTDDAVTHKGMIDLIFLALNTNPWDAPFVAEHFQIIHVTGD